MLETITHNNICSALLAYGGRIYFHDQFGDVLCSELRYTKNGTPEILTSLRSPRDYETDRVKLGIGVADSNIIHEHWSDNTNDCIWSHVSFTDEGEPLLDDWYDWAPY